jgi:hypothetical protein
LPGNAGELAKPLDAHERVERVAFVLQSMTVPVEDTAIVLRRLQFSGGTLRGCVAGYGRGFAKYLEGHRAGAECEF